MLLVDAVWAAAFPAMEKRASELELPQEQQEEQDQQVIVSEVEIQESRQ